MFGWIADKYISPRHMLGLQGLVMAGASVAAGAFGPNWPVWLIMVVCGIAGATASGYTGLAFAEYARLGGSRRTEATGLGAAVMFAGVMLIPSTMGFTLTATGNYMLCFAVLAALAAVAGVVVGLPLRRG